MSFRALRVSADVLRLAASTHPALRPFAVELFRGQTAFNHRLADVLEDLRWLATVPDRAARIEARLGPWVEPVTKVFNARGGTRGWLIAWAKRAGLVGLEPMVANERRAWAVTNRRIVDALKSGGPLPAHPESSVFGGLAPWFAAQRAFYADAADAAATATADPLPTRAPRPPTTSGPHARIQVVAPGDPIAADAEVVVRLPTGEALVDGALDAIVAAFTSEPGLELCYGDTFFTASRTPGLKPAWSPDYLWATNYIGGCFAMRAARARQLDASAPALAWLLGPGFSERQVARLPHVLSERSAPEPDSLADLEVARRCLADRGQISLRGGHRAVDWNLPPGTTVTIVVPFKDQPRLLASLWASLTRFDPGVPFSLVLASNQSSDPATFALQAELAQDPRVSRFAWDHPFNWSAINNAAAARARDPLLLFLNNDVEATHDGWLRSLAGFAAHPEIGVAGARLLFPDGSLQHAGMVIGLKGLAGHAFARWRPEYGPTPFGPPDATRNWSAVTGACLMIRRALFDQLGGFDERIRVSGGDVELCLRARKRGLRVVCAGHAVLTHHESATRGDAPVPDADVRREVEAYADALAAGDPYHHPALSNEVGHGWPGPRSQDSRFTVFSAAR